MGQPMHIVDVADASVTRWSDRLVVGVQNNVANASAAAGVAVTVAVSFADLPTDASGNGVYGVFVTPSQEAMVAITNKTATGFHVVLYPKDASTALAAGTFDVLVVA